jgi:hypothetical protein
MKKALLLTAVLFSLCISASAQKLKVTAVDGGWVKTRLRNGVDVNDKSSLRRSWINIDDPSCPVQLSQVGVYTGFFNDDYRYRAAGTITPAEPIAAVELTFILYDVFGHHIQTLGLVRVEDISANESYELRDFNWSAWEPEVSQLLTVVSYVSQVRLVNGRVWHANEKAVSDEIARMQLQTGDDIFTPKLEPK